MLLYASSRQLSSADDLALHVGRSVFPQVDQPSPTNVYHRSVAEVYSAMSALTSLMQSHMVLGINRLQICMQAVSQ